MMEKKSPWSNVPKMSRKQAADWKKDPMNRKNWRKRPKVKVVQLGRLGSLRELEELIFDFDSSKGKGK